MTTLVAKDILLTGASGAIGSALARRLGADGFRLHLTSRDPRRLRRLKAELEARGTTVRVWKLDLSDLARCRRVVDAFFADATCPAGLICNAGDYALLGSFRDADFNRWQEGVSRNFFSHAAMIHAFCRKFPRRPKTHASIIVLSGAGLGGQTTFAQASAYSTAKAAITHLVEALSPELSPLGISINAISPGMVRSGMTDQALRAGKRAPRFFASAKDCIKTGGVSPDLAAQLASFLLSDDARAITGRLLSARFDRDHVRENAAHVASDANLYRLRRIDGHHFSEKSS